LKLAIIHFSPVELYPPAMNWLNFLAKHLDEGSEVRVYTMEVSADFKKFESPLPSVKIIRTGRQHQFNLFRYWNYIKFYSSVSRQLLTWKPETIMYYETISALPAIIYSKIFKRNCRLFIHYHEYTSSQEYKNGMLISRYVHLMEKGIYPFVKWISHTNKDRMLLFKTDHAEVILPNTYIIPNYPPGSWKSQIVKDKLDDPLRFVYVGALNLNDMYISQITEWIVRQKGAATLDFYSDNITPDTKKYLYALQSDQISFQGAVNYFSLPGILKKYDVGLILYKGHIPNYIYNAPNKLFEYWACGLDVWFPNTMKSSLPYSADSSYPKILPVDFEQMNNYDLYVLTDRTGMECRPSVYYSEGDFEYMLNKIISDEG
jgi:hypothetical protein